MSVQSPEIFRAAQVVLAHLASLWGEEIPYPDSLVTAINSLPPGKYSGLPHCRSKWKNSLYRQILRESTEILKVAKEVLNESDCKKILRENPGLFCAVSFRRTVPGKSDGEPVPAVRRTVFGTAKGITTVEAAYFGPILRELQLSGFCPEWVDYALINDTLVWPKNEHWFGADYTGFDKHISPDLLAVVFAIIQSLYHGSPLPEWKESPAEILSGEFLFLWYYLSHSGIVTPDGLLLFLEAHGVMSGSGGTNLLETILNWVLALAFLMWCGMYADVTPELLKPKGRVRSLGDDLLLRLPNRLDSPELFQEWSAGVGLEVKIEKQWYTLEHCTVYLQQLWSELDDPSGSADRTGYHMVGMEAIKWPRAIWNPRPGEPALAHVVRWWSQLHTLEGHVGFPELIEFFIMKDEKTHLGRDLLNDYHPNQIVKMAGTAAIAMMKQDSREGKVSGPLASWKLFRYLRKVNHRKKDRRRRIPKTHSQMDPKVEV
jgi:hypothetical protein